MTRQLSSEMVHASCVARAGRAVLLLGPSGAGKSDLALRLIDRGFALVSDDQTLVRRDGNRLVASAPATIRGKLEVRGLGIVEQPPLDQADIALAVQLGGEVVRFPEERQGYCLLGETVPLVGIDAHGASAAIKVELALELLDLTQ